MNFFACATTSFVGLDLYNDLLISLFLGRIDLIFLTVSNKLFVDKTLFKYLTYETPNFNLSLGNVLTERISPASILLLT